MNDVLIRDLNGMDEFRAAEKLQYSVWGEDEVVVPGDIMMVIQAEGGIAAGTFKDGDLIGFVFGFPTRQPDLQHSHLLAVRPDARGLGLGARLKWYQRDWCLKRAITRIRWTFDPLRAVNAALNLRRLGAVCMIYHTDFYGKMKGLNAGAPSDRVVADWHLESVRVRARAERDSPISDNNSSFHIGIPADFGALLISDPDFALSERLRVREEMQKAFENGLCLTNFDTKSMNYELQPSISAIK